MTLKLTAQPEEHQKRSWTVLTEYRNRNDAKVAVVRLAFEQGAIEFLRFSGEPPPEGYKVELPPPREAKKAKRKATDTAENEDGNPKKKPKLLSQTGQFLAATGQPKPTVVLAATTRPPSAVPMFLPRPGYVDSKPEPGELPDEPPATIAPWRPALASFQRTRDQLPPPPPPRPVMESRSEPRGPYDYGVREHGHQYELGVGGARYDDPGVYAPDPYYAPPAPAPHTEPWHARSYPPEDDEYRGAYYGNDYAPSTSSYDYDYARHSRYTPPPPLPPEPAPPPHTYDDLARRSGYDEGDYAYAHIPPALRRSQQRTPPPLLSPPPPSPPPPGPPRVWQPGPHAARMDEQLPAASSASASSALGSSSAHNLHSMAPTPASERTASSYTPSSCKEELIGGSFRLRM